MQIIEHNSFNLRAVVTRLRREGSPLELLLLPMLHIGSPEYYAKVSEYLRSADAIIYEGVGSKRASVLLRAQRIIRRFGYDEFIHQSEGIDLASMRDKLVRGDVSVATFDEEWGRIPLRIRAMLWCVVPFAALYLAVTGTKASLARSLATDDLPSRSAVLEDWEVADHLDRVILDLRDAKLIETIRTYVEEHGSEAKTVAVLYGAGHMGRVVGLLTGPLRYRIAASDWVVVFEI